MSDITPENAPAEPVRITAEPNEDYTEADIPALPQEQPVPENDIDLEEPR